MQNMQKLWFKIYSWVLTRENDGVGIILHMAEKFIFTKNSMIDYVKLSMPSS